MYKYLTEQVCFLLDPVYEVGKFIGRSEYQDTISKMGLSNIRAMQQYREPLPSTRRRLGEQCI